MNKKTDMKKLKETAKAFLYIDYKESSLGKLFLYHPVFNSCYQAYITDDNKTNIIDITEDAEGFQKVLSYYENSIDKTKTISDLLLIIQKSYWLTFFDYINTYLSLEDYSKTLAEIWVGSENPNQDVNVSIFKSSQFFQKADKQIMMTEDEYAYYYSLPERISVFRGVSPGRAHDGLSWTDDKEKAIWFANRFTTDNQKGYLLEGITEKKYILAYFNCRGESELVIYPKNVKKIKKQTL